MKTSATPVTAQPTIIRVTEWHLEDRTTRTLRTAEPVMPILTDSRNPEDWQIRLMILSLIATIAMMEWIMQIQFLTASVISVIQQEAH
jgi:hypothetical protein